MCISADLLIQVTDTIWSTYVHVYILEYCVAQYFGQIKLLWFTAQKHFGGRKTLADWLYSMANQLE